MLFLSDLFLIQMLFSLELVLNILLSLFFFSPSFLFSKLSLDGGGSFILSFAKIGNTIRLGSCNLLSCTRLVGILLSSDWWSNHLLLLNSELLARWDRILSCTFSHFGHLLIQVVQSSGMLVNLRRTHKLSFTFDSFSLEPFRNAGHDLVFGLRDISTTLLGLSLGFHVTSDLRFNLSVLLGASSSILILACSVTNVSDWLSEDFSLVELLNIFFSHISCSSKQLHFLFLWHSVDKVGLGSALLSTNLRFGRWIFFRTTHTCRYFSIKITV